MVISIRGAAVHNHAEAAAFDERATAADLSRAAVERDGDLAGRGKVRAEQK